MLLTFAISLALAHYADLQERLNIRAAMASIISLLGFSVVCWELLYRLLTGVL